MPIPQPKSGEKENEFISRCVSAIYNEYGEDQSLGICYSTWREGKMSKSSYNKVAMKIAKFRTQKLEEPCWDNYIQIGTKIVDGREVPDCRGPVE